MSSALVCPCPSGRRPEVRKARMTTKKGESHPVSPALGAANGMSAHLLDIPFGDNFKGSKARTMNFCYDDVRPASLALEASDCSLLDLRCLRGDTQFKGPEVGIPKPLNESNCEGPNPGSDSATPTSLILTRNDCGITSAKETDTTIDENMKRLYGIRKLLRTAIEEVMEKTEVVLLSRSPMIGKLKELRLHLEIMRQDLKKIDRQIYDALPLEDLESDVERCEKFDCDILRLASDLQLRLAEFEKRPLYALAQRAESSLVLSK